MVGMRQLGALRAIAEYIEAVMQNLVAARQRRRIGHRAEVDRHGLLALDAYKMVMMMGEAAGTEFESVVQVNLLQDAHIAKEPQVPVHRIERYAGIRAPH